MRIPSHFKALCLISVITSASACANPLDLYMQRYQQKMQALATLHSDDAIQTFFYQQQVDHTKTELGTFAQRYYIDESNSASNSDPVFFYICGEAACEKDALSGPIRNLAEKYHAKLIALEHRYYGTSMPRPTLSAADLQYLTVDNALQDIVSFIRAIQNERHWTGKWISFGGSYPGVISAYFHEKHPELTAGAIASSAPVIPMQTYPGYDEHVTKVVGPECAANIRTAINEVEAAMNHDPERLAQIKASFNAADVSNNLDFLGLLADVAGAAVQYGYSGPLCSMMKFNTTPLAGYAKFSTLMFNMVNVKPIQITPQGVLSENINDYEDFIGMRQWFYQTCKEFGAWNIASNDAAKSTRSSRLDTQYNQDVCNRLFGITTPPNVEKFNLNYYKPLLDETITRNIYFTNGSQDPWSRMSLIEDNGNTTNKALSYYMIEGGSHCNDLRGEISSAAIAAARDKMDSLVAAWLKA